jgi:DNA adenine methylase
MIENQILKPLVKWPGGKDRELKHFKHLFPEKFNDFYEPFIGGGAVYFSLNNHHSFYINDKSHELINFYSLIKEENKKFIDYLIKVNKSWIEIDDFKKTYGDFYIDTYTNFSKDIKSEEETIKIIEEYLNIKENVFLSLLKIDIKKEIFLKEVKKSITSKIKRMKDIEKKKHKLPEEDILDNILGSIKNAFYMYIRNLYNNVEEYELEKEFASVLFYFIRMYTYSGMFRYNKAGKFNVPYGGIGYNKKTMDKKIEYFQNKYLIEHFQKTKIFEEDFENFFNITKPKSEDFIFLDPPYDSEFSTYAKNTFDQEDQKRLASYLIEKCEAKWMLVIKNTELISSLYEKNLKTIGGDKKIFRIAFDKKYQVSFMDRNDKEVEHLIITNYELNLNAI